MAMLLLQCKNKPTDSVAVRPNFVFIAIDDLNEFTTTLGQFPGNFLEKIYPNEVLRAKVVKRLTPNIERLAQSATVFEKAYCAAPLCGPSRTALLTGVPPHLSGYYKHDRHFRAYETLTGVTTLPQYLKENGYYTAGIGKVFHKGRSYLDRGYFSDWPDQLYSWNDWVEVYTGTSSGPDFDVELDETLSKYWKNPNKKSLNFTRFGITNVPREKSNDYLNAAFIADLIKNGEAERINLSQTKQKIVLPKDKPYFLACGLFAPHLPWVVPKEFVDMFPLQEMEIDESILEYVQNDLKDLSNSGKRVAENTHFEELIAFGQQLDGEGGDIYAWKAYIQAYLATIAFSDRNLGALLEAIEENPQKENTIVVLWSDHGYHIGDKNRTGKTTLWEAANHSNFMIYDPRISKENKKGRVKTPVSLQDIYPTIIALAGLDRPSHVHGYDISNMMYRSGHISRTAVLSTHQEGNHSIRTDELRFLRFKNGDVELYNMKDDPFEYHNLIDSTEHSRTIDSLNTMLNQILSLKASDYITE